MKTIFSCALQEDLLTLLAHSDEFGKLVALGVEPNLFEGEYRVIAERCCDYWRQQKQAPKHQLDTLMADYLEDESNAKSKTFRRIMISMVHSYEDINAKYVIEKMRMFVRAQGMKLAVMEAAQALSTVGDTTIEQVETALQNILRSSDAQFDTGMRLTDIEKLLTYLSEHGSEFTTGVGQLDQNHIVPARGELMMLIAPTGIGKTWWLNNLGKHALMQRKKVCHVTLEMPPEQLMQRYIQAMFSVTKRNSEVPITVMQKKDGELVALERDWVTPDFTFSSPELSMELNTCLRLHGGKMDNLVIKQFPPRQLSLNGLNTFLDSLEKVDNFVPDLLLVDYPGIMKIDPRDKRSSIGDNVIGIRAIAVERNLAAAAVHQSSKAGAQTSSVRGHHVSEDWTVCHTADVILTLSASEGEQRNGLARIFVDKVRSEPGHWEILITQNYDLGQFCLNSIRMNKKYQSMIKEVTNEEGPEDEDETDEDGFRE